MKKNNIVLIGFMGCGKSTVGKKLAGALSYEFSDTDAMIEEAYGKTISKMFEEDGEEYFRTAETELLQKLSAEAKGLVLATGGGMPMREENAALLKEIGTVIFLETKIETILERLQNDTGRPLADGEDREARLRPLYEKRLPVYRAAADYILDTEAKSFYAIIEEIKTVAENVTEQ
ncbi:MAG: shikimate kinase [Lachnospiraceae bacterium]|nr:shikimate kinase [Lachnospiraceae bacterium]